MKLPPRLQVGIALAAIVTCGIIELLFAAVLVTSFFNENASFTERISPLFAMCIFAFPIWWGVQVLKSSKAKTAAQSNDQALRSTGEAIRINATITLSDYRDITFRQVYLMPAFIFLHVIGAFFFVTFLSQHHWDWSVYIMIFFLLLPISIGRAAVKQYESAKILHDGVTYTFTTETISCEGQTYNSTLKWEALFKAKETNEFFLLYANASAAMFIPKRAFASEADIAWMRNKVRTIG